MDYLGRNTTYVKKVNKELIRQYLKEVDSATNAEIASVTKLSVSTSSNILNELIDTKEVMICDEIESNGGRPARRYYYNPDYEYEICMYAQVSDTQKTISYVVFDSIGKELEFEKIVADCVDADFVLDIIERLVEKYRHIGVIGFGVPGITEGGVIKESDIKELEGVNLQQRIKEKHDVFVQISNEMNYMVYGYYKNVPSATNAVIAYLAFAGGECPGCGFVVGGRVVNGANGFAGEVKYLFPRDEAGRTVIFNHGDDMVKAATDIMIPIISIMNPEIVVVTGSLIEKEYIESIKKGCKTIIPEDYLPEFIYRGDSTKDYIKGLLELTLEERVNKELGLGVSRM